MRLLIFHVERFSYTATQKGRSVLVEPLASKTQTFEDGLLILAAAEAGDERDPDLVCEQAAAEVGNLAAQLGAVRALVHPFAHLFGEPAPLEAARDVLDLLVQKLRERALDAHRSPFGWFFSWELRARGHPMSRLARRFTVMHADD